MASSGKGTFQPDSDVHISFEDQQKINKFARLNAKSEDFRGELKVMHNDLKNIDEACEELSLADDDAIIPYLVDEVFIGQKVEETLEFLEQAKTRKKQEIKKLEEKQEEVKSQLDQLKGHLYGKFGSHINLEKEEE